MPSTPTILKLFAGGAAGLLVWELWARVLTKAVLGYPLEPAGLIDAIANHLFGLQVPYLLREAMHYGVGIVGYPVAYYVISRHVPRWGLVLDAVVFVTFSAGYLAEGGGRHGHAGHVRLLQRGRRPDRQPLRQSQPAPRRRDQLG